MNDMSPDHRHNHGALAFADAVADPMAGRDPLDFFYRKGQGIQRWAPGEPQTFTMVREQPAINAGTARELARCCLTYGAAGLTIEVPPSGMGHRVHTVGNVPPGQVLVSRELMVALLALASTMPERHEVTK